MFATLVLIVERKLSGPRLDKGEWEVDKKDSKAEESGSEGGQDDEPDNPFPWHKD